MSASEILPSLMSKIVEDYLNNPETRQALVARAETKWIADTPAAVLLPPKTRAQVLQAMWEQWAGDPRPSGRLSTESDGPAVAAMASAAAPYTYELPNEFGLGVRSIIIRADANSTEAQVQESIGPIEGWTLEKPAGLDGFFALRPSTPSAVTVSQAWELARQISQQPGILEAEPAIRQLPDRGSQKEAAATASAFEHFGMEDHNIPETRTQPEWSLNRTFAHQAWPSGKMGEGVFIGHIDTGYTQHPEVIGNIDVHHGYDTWDDDPDAKDEMDPSLWDKIRSTSPVANPGHGTGTGSVIASPEGKQDGHVGKFGITGTAPKATLIPIRATPTVLILPTGSADEVALGILKAVEQGAKVISMSLGSPFGASDLQAAVNQALKAGVIVCAAAGNVVTFESALTGVTYPAAYSGVVAVAGCDYNYRP